MAQIEKSQFYFRGRGLGWGRTNRSSLGPQDVIAPAAVSCSSLTSSVYANRLAGRGSDPNCKP